MAVVRHTGGMASDRAAPGFRHYGDHRPYPDPPARLADLKGPISGTVELPTTIDWGPNREYDMARDEDRRIAYERVLREAATTDEVAQFVNGSCLAEVWPRLFLPRRIRHAWEERFPELRRVA